VLSVGVFVKSSIRLGGYLLLYKGGQRLDFFCQYIKISSFFGADADNVREAKVIIITDRKLGFYLFVFDVNFIHDENSVQLFIFFHDVSEDMLFFGSDPDSIIDHKK